MPSNKIHDVHSLEKAIIELEMKKKMLEVKLEANAEHFQKNFVSMAVRSAIPSGLQEGPIASAGNFLKTEKLKEGFSKLMGSVSELASDGMETLVNKFRKKNEEKS